MSVIITDPITHTTSDDVRNYELERAKTARAVKKAVTTILERLVDSDSRNGSKLEIGAGDAQALNDLPAWMLNNAVLLEPEPELVEEGLQRHPNIQYVTGGLEDMPELLDGRRFDVVYGKDLDSIPDVALLAERAYSSTADGGVFFHYKDLLPHYEAIHIRLKKEDNIVVFRYGFGFDYKDAIVFGSDVEVAVDQNGRVDKDHVDELVEKGVGEVVPMNGYYERVLSGELRNAGFSRVRTFTLNQEVQGERIIEQCLSVSNYFLNFGGLLTEYLVESYFSNGQEHKMEEGRVSEFCSIPMVVAWKQ